MRSRYLLSESPPPSTSGSSNRQNTLIIVVGVCLIGLASISVAIALILCRKRRNLKKLSSLSFLKAVGYTRFELIQFRFPELEKATRSFSAKCLIGSGSCGTVYKGVFDDGQVFAIKRSHDNAYQSIEEFRNEVDLLSRVRHANLVGLVGYCEEGKEKILVYEYVPHGSLLEYIAGRTNRTLGWRQRLMIAIGAAKGIAHLHEGVKPSIIHRDIKPSNILLGDGFEAKVSDFDLVRSGPVDDRSHVSSQIKGTPGYLDPAYCKSFHLTPFSDVYSFGIILLQLVTARPAIDKSSSPSHIVPWARPSLEKGRVEDIIDANLLFEQCNMEVMLKIGQLGLRCAAKNPKSRPKMSEVTQELEEVLHSALPLIQSSRRSCKSGDRVESQSMSIDGIGFQKFIIEAENMSIQTASLKCLDVNSINFSIDEEDELGG